MKAIFIIFSLLCPFSSVYAMSSCEQAWGIKQPGPIIRIKLRLKKGLANTDLSGLDLQLWELRRVNLNGANLFRSSLQSSELAEAKLQNAKLIEANLQRVGLVWANLENAILDGANLERANLRWAILKGADFTRTNLRYAILVGANLERANFTEADLTGATVTQKQAEYLKSQGRSGFVVVEETQTKDPFFADLTGLDLTDAYSHGPHFSWEKNK